MVMFYKNLPPVPPPLNPPSPEISPTQSWSSETGVIPILLDPSLSTASPSGEMIMACDSESLLPSHSLASVGTFGQPLRRPRQHPRDLNLQVSARVNAWRDVDTTSCFPSFNTCHNILLSPSSPTELYSLVDPWPSSSSSSTPTTASFPLIDDVDDDSYLTEKESMFTLSAYFASASAYGDSDGTLTLTADEHTTHRSPLIVHPHPHQEQGSSTCNILTGETGKKTPSPAGHVTIKMDDVAHSSSFDSAILLHKTSECIDAEGDTPRSLHRRKSELDVPSSPTSTVLLSPSTSTSSQHGLHSTAIHLSTSSNIQLPYGCKHTHHRTASAPLSPVSYSSHRTGDTNATVVSAALPCGTAQSSYERKFRSVSNSHVIDAKALSIRDAAHSNSFKIESVDDLFSKGHSKGSCINATLDSNASLVPVWIRSTNIELWIDQEGFRSIHPKFDLVAYWTESGLGPSGQLLDVAEFAMRRRQTWHFHHATFDSPPVLRRLTVNGDLNDYISRQATLTLKHNGVYSVESTEDKGKLAWKFKYLVEDRWAPDTGRIINGEKRFTPLSFVCNPELLTSEHGKKVKLLHFVKKSVTPKLQSFRISQPSARTPSQLRKTVANVEQHSIDREQWKPGQAKDSVAPSLVFPDASETERPSVKSQLKSSVCSRDGKLLGHYRHPVEVDAVVLGANTMHPVTAPNDTHVKHPRPGQRIVSPSVLLAWFPAHHSPDPN